MDIVPLNWTFLSIAVPIASLAIAISAFAVSFLNYRRKSSLDIRGLFSTADSIATDHTYVASVLIENRKDRAITVFGIYLRIGWNYYLKIEDFNEPLILGAFQSWQKDYGPVDFYVVSSRKIDLSELFSNCRIRKHLVLSTSGGKYVVKTVAKRWSPVHDFFNNYATAPISPVTTTYKSVALGNRVKYIVDVVSATGTSVVLPIYPDDGFHKFRGFALTAESLESSIKLEKFLRKKMKEGILVCKNVRVVDADEARTDGDFYQNAPLIIAKPMNYFAYHFGGRFLTMYKNRQLRRKNQANKIKASSKT